MKKQPKKKQGKSTTKAARGTWPRDVLSEATRRMSVRIMDLSLDHPGNPDVRELHVRYRELLRLADGGGATNPYTRRLLGEALKVLDTDTSKVAAGLGRKVK